MHLRAYYAYLTAARAELWSFLGGLPEEELDRALIPGELYQSIKHLLLHVADVEDYWVHEVVRGAAPVLATAWPGERPARENEWLPLEWIRGYTLAVQEATGAYLETVDDAELRRIARPPDAPSRSWTVESLLWHTLTHEVRHSAQVVLLVRQLGHTPPWLDFLRFTSAPIAVQGEVSP